MKEIYRARRDSADVTEGKKYEFRITKTHAYFIDDADDERCWHIARFEKFFEKVYQSPDEELRNVLLQL